MHLSLEFLSPTWTKLQQKNAKQALLFQSQTHDSKQIAKDFSDANATTPARIFSTQMPTAAE